MFQSGDGQAFEDLYRRYFKRVYRFCLKRVGDRHEAEEIAQETFARAYSAMPRLAGQRRFYPWLSVIASRLCVDSHRRRGRDTLTDAVHEQPSDALNEDAVLAEVDRDLLVLALDRLGPRHREILKLREHEGWSYQEIATHLGVTVGTVEALLFRARRALRREFRVVGGEGRLLALPAVAWLAERATDARFRLAELLTPAAPVLAAGAMSVAVVGGGVLTTTAPAAPPPNLGAANTASVATVPVAAVEPVSGPVEVPSPANAAVDAPLITPSPAEAVAEPSRPIRDATRPVGGGTNTEAESEAQQHRLRVSLGTSWLSADIRSIVGDLTP